MRLFNLIRETDVSGVSGTGIVAEGVVLSNGMCAMSWLSEIHSITVYKSIAELIQIHGHEGSTILRYVYDENLL